MMNDITKLPKWAQKRIEDLETMNHSLNTSITTLIGDQKESHVYTTSLVKISGSMEPVKTYFSIEDFHPVVINDGNGLEMRVRLLEDRGFDIQLTGDSSFDIGVYPKFSNAFEVK